jgi:hypothetical protein
MLLKVISVHAIFQSKAMPTVKLFIYLALSRYQVHKKFWWKKHERKRPPGRPKRRRKKILKFPFKKYNVSVQNGLIWLRIGAIGGLL